MVQRLHLRWRRWQLVSTRGRILVLLVGLVMAITVLTGDVASRVSVQPVYAAQRLDESSAGSSTAAGPSDAPLGQTPVPFACDGNGYIVQGNQARLQRVNTGQVPYTFTPIGTTNPYRVNALGYRPSDNLLYGWAIGFPGGDQIVLIDATGAVTALGVPAGLPATTEFASGTISNDSATYYLLQAGASGTNTLFIVDLAAFAATSIPLATTVNVRDFAQNPNDGLLYAVSFTPRLLRINPGTGAVQQAVVPGLAASNVGYGAAWFTASGDLIAYENNGTLYQISVSSNSLQSAQPGPASTSNDGASCAQRPPSADLTLSKAVSPSPVQAGGALSYSLTPFNAGPDSAAGPVTVSDALPAGLTGITASGTGWSCTVSGQDVSCTRGDALPLGPAPPITIQATAPLTVGTLDNLGSVTSPTADPAPINNVGAVSVTVAAAADLGLTKVQSAAAVLVGETLIYTLTVTNNGPSPATSVTLTDALSANLTFVSATPSRGGCSGTTTVTCVLGTLGASAGATVTIVGRAASVGVVRNSAHVEAAEPDPNPADNNATTDATASAEVPRIGVAKDAGAIVDHGDGSFTVPFTLRLENFGNVPLSTVQVTDDLAAAFAGATSVSVVPGSVAATGGLTANPAFNGTMSQDLLTGGSLGPGAAATVSFSVRVSPGSNLGPYGNAVQATGQSPGLVTTTDLSDAGSDPDPDGDGDPNEPGENDPTTVLFAPSADLAATETVQIVGNAFRFDLTVTNNGPSQAAGVTLTQTFNAPITVVSISPPAATCTGAGVAVTCTLNALNNGASTTVTIVVQPAGAAPSMSIATVATQTPDPVPGNNRTPPLSLPALPAATPTLTPTPTPTATPSPSPTLVPSSTPLPLTTPSPTPSPTPTAPAPSADLAITKRVEPAAPQPAQTISSTLTVTNNGPAPATGVRVTDQIQGQATFVAAAGASCTLASGIVTCEAGSLAVGASTTVTLTHRVDGAGVLTNVGGVTATERDANLANNVSTVIVNVGVSSGAASPDLVLTKTARTTTADDGGTVRFDLVVRNGGMGDASEVIVRDALPAALQAVAATTSQGSCSTGQTVVCTLGTVRSGDRATVEITTRTTGTGPVTNTASVQAAEVEPRVANNEASVTIAIGGTSASPNNDDEDDPARLTEAGRQQRQRTNRSGLDDERTEGNVVATRCEAGIVGDPTGWMDDGKDGPYVMIANRDGLVKVVLLGDAATTCTSIRNGGYLEATGAKQTEQLFEAGSVTLK